MKLTRLLEEPASWGSRRAMLETQQQIIDKFDLIETELFVLEKNRQEYFALKLSPVLKYWKGAEVIIVQDKNDGYFHGLRLDGAPLQSPPHYILDRDIDTVLADIIGYWVRKNISSFTTNFKAHYKLVKLPDDQGFDNFVELLEYALDDRISVEHLDKVDDPRELLLDPEPERQDKLNRSDFAYAADNGDNCYIIWGWKKQ